MSILILLIVFVDVRKKRELPDTYSATLCNFQECNHINTSMGPLPSAIVLQYAIRNPSNIKIPTTAARLFVGPWHFCLHKDIILYSIKKTHFYTFGSWDYILHDIYYSNYKKMISKLLQVLHLYFLIAISHDNVSIL